MAQRKGTKTLSERQARFAAEYTIDLNGQKAAERAGYATKGAAVEASRLLTNPNIQNEIARLKAQQLQRADVNADKVLLGLARIACADIRQLFNPDNSVKAPKTSWSGSLRAERSRPRESGGRLKRPTEG